MRCYRSFVAVVRLCAHEGLFDRPAGAVATVTARVPRRSRLAAALLAFSCFAGAIAAAPPLEYPVKAAYLYNFARFVAWPGLAFDDPTRPMVIGVAASPAVFEQMRGALEGQFMGKSPVHVRSVATADDAAGCEVVFFAASEAERTPEFLQALDGRPVLTVGETSSFLSSGGMIRFFFESDHVRFEINVARVEAAGLKASSQLLQFAKLAPAREAP